jgi:hypothetical protein
MIFVHDIKRIHHPFIFSISQSILKGKGLIGVAFQAQFIFGYHWLILCLDSGDGTNRKNEYN